MVLPAYIRLQQEFGGYNYKAMDIVLNRGEGDWIWDAAGN